MNHDFWLGMTVGLVVGLLLGGVIGGYWTFDWISRYIQRRWGIDLHAEAERPDKRARPKTRDSYDSEL